MTEVEKRFDDLVKWIETISAFPTAGYLRIIYNKCRLNQNQHARQLSDMLQQDQMFRPNDRDENTTMIAGENLWELFRAVTNQTFIRALHNTSLSDDKHRLRNAANRSNAEWNQQKQFTTEVMTLCWADNLRFFLPDHLQLRRLHELRGFRDHMKNVLASPSWVRHQNRINAERQDHLFGMVMLYILDYIDKPHPSAWNIPAPSSSYTDRASYHTACVWSWVLWEDWAANSSLRIDDLMIFFGKLSSLVFLPMQNLTSPRPQSLYTSIVSFYELMIRDDWVGKNILDKPRNILDTYIRAIREGLERLTRNMESVNRWKNDTDLLYSGWITNMVPRFQGAMNRGIVQIRRTHNGPTEITHTGDPVYLWLDLGTADVRSAFEDYEKANLWVLGYKTQYHGNPEWRTLFTSSPPDNREYYTPDQGGCFAPGTEITIKGGVKSVEDIKEWDHVVTLSEPEQYGTVSNERVMHRIKIPLIGFNDEAPFATPGHVFHTTTGLRAVNPSPASQENPWLDVRTLKVGHYLYKLREDGRSGYDTVKIESINYSSTELRSVHGIHMHSGLRSYHANGYLAHLNYPEMTIQSIANTLKTFSPTQRISFLESVKQLRPLFRKFGLQTIADRLSIEVDGPEEARQMARLNHEEFQNRSIDARFLMPETKRVCQSDFSELVKEFSLVPESSSHPALETHTLPGITLVEGAVLVDGSVVPHSQVNCDDLTVRWSRKIGTEGDWEHGGLKFDITGVSAAGGVLFCDEFEPATVAEEDVIPVETFSVQERNGSERSLSESSSPRKAEPIAKPDADHLADHAVKPGAEPVALTNLTDHGRFTTQTDFKMIFDRTVWPDGVNRTDAVSPTDGGILVQAIFTTKESMTVPCLRVPVLDRLCDHINERFRKGEPRLDPFYTSSVTLSIENKSRYFVEVNAAALIPFISNSGPNVNLWNISFRDIGFNETLPFLYQSLYIEFTGFARMEGAMYAYDPTMRGMKGDRYFISGREMFGRSHREELRAQVSSEMGAYTKPGSLGGPDSSFSPSSITGRFLTILRVRDLMNLANYDDELIHSTKEILIQDMMEFHMDQDQRTRFLTGARPTNLPQELSNRLPSHLQRFLRDEYAPAFLSRSLAQDEDYGKNFTDSERRKIRYWWEGNGRTCLARSKEYNEITNLATQWAIRRLYNDILKDFFGSRDGPVVWADRMFEAQMNPVLLHSVVANPISLSGVNILNMRITIMNTLAPNKSYASDLFKEVVALATEHSMIYPFSDDDPAKVTRFLNDAFSDLILKVLQNHSSIARDVRSGLLDDLRAFEQANRLNQSLSPELRTNNIMQLQGVLIGEISKWVASVGIDVAKAFGGVSMFTWADAAFDHAEKQATTLTGRDRLRGIAGLSLVGFQFLGIASDLIGIIQDWEDLDPVEKGLALLETYQAITDAVDDAKEAWERFKKGNSRSVEKNLDSTSLTQSVQKKVRKDPSTMSNLSDKVSGKQGSMSENIGDRLRDSGQAGSGNRKESWNQPTKHDPPGASPGGKKKGKRISKTDQLLGGLDAILGIVTTIDMVFSLIADWNELTTAGKILETMSVIVQGLTTLLDIAMVGINIGIKVGLIAAKGTLAVTIPVIGAVLAVIGIIITFLSFFIRTRKKPDPPPPDPVVTFINQVAKPLIHTWMEAPNPALQHAVSPTPQTAGRDARVTTEVRNNSSRDVRFRRLRINLNGGTEPTCLFRQDNFQLQNGQFQIEPLSDMDGGPDAFSTKPGTIQVHPLNKVRARLEMTWFDKHTVFELSLFGNPENPETPNGDLLLKPWEVFRAEWNGTIHSRGESMVDFIEVTEDNIREDYEVKRT